MAEPRLVLVAGLLAALVGASAAAATSLKDGASTGPDGGSRLIAFTAPARSG